MPAAPTRSPRLPAHPLARTALAAAATGVAGLGYAAGIERNAFALREATLPVLAPGSSSITVLHVSDLHMTPGQHRKQRWVRELEQLDPDLVVNTGDNLAHPRAVPSVVQALDPLLARPGLFVFGSNDYFAPTAKNPAHYLWAKDRRVHGAPLPWADLRAAFSERGWLDATHTRHRLEVGGVRIAVVGVDDPHLQRERMATVAGAAPEDAELRLALTHSPEPRVLDAFADDGYDLVLAGHTHGGQLCIPFLGAVVTNCELDRSRAKGPSRWGEHTWLHVSAGLGTSPYAPVRFACRPEASLLTLVAAPAGSRSAPLAVAERAVPVGGAPGVG